VHSEGDTSTSSIKEVNRSKKVNAPYIHLRDIQTFPAAVDLQLKMIAAKPFPPGIHVPCLTWFADDARQEIDWDLQKQHLRFLISSGLHGVVLAGTNGEAVTLSPAEKQSLVRATREIALDLGRKSEDFTITLGCGGQSTQHVIEETKQAADAGADYALVLVPS